MKTIKLNAIITGIRSKVDRSLGLTIGTPELSVEEKAEIMRLQGVNSILTIKPMDTEPEGTMEIDTDLDTKSQSQRIRSVLFLNWKQEGEPRDFRDYYRSKTEKYIDFLKDKLDFEAEEAFTD